ncbi:endonuclease III [Simkania negevensis]|uniref:Endonuclease III n=1 Tax=Simkania negevensis (strain ATCC VR-1471 / DSM 27360 / Z) TaxID=331113 RepID=F8L5U7_SIMNZ|nr:endonuclease III [Simkania negevensis]CCB88089.1 putative endonuclease III [Simkania negevensis Z]
MNKKQRAAFVQKTLNHYFPKTPIPLKHTSAYTLLIAVLLSARCTDKRVNEITPKLFAKASTPKAMAALPVQTIQAIIKPCGLSPTKAKNIKKLSEILLEDYGSQVPKELEELEKLPGVGHKTASVVVAQAFKQPAFPVDTHIHRCAKRWGLSSGKNVKQTEKDLKALFPKKSWRKLHLQIIYFGRAFCMARAHKVSECPICSQL